MTRTAPHGSVCASVGAAWVICWSRCIRLANAGCSCFCELVALSVASPAPTLPETVAPDAAPPPASVPFHPARKEPVIFCAAPEAPDAALRPAACAPVLATLPKPAIAQIGRAHV